MKCRQYWPDEGTRQFGMITVGMKDEEMFSEFVLRTFKISQVQFDRMDNTKSEYIIYISWEREHHIFLLALNPQRMLYVESLSSTVQNCLPEAFRLSPSSEFFYLKKNNIKMELTNKS